MERGARAVRKTRSPLFTSAVLPKTVFPPLFNRYDADGDMHFGSHVDNAIRSDPVTGVRRSFETSSASS